MAFNFPNNPTVGQKFGPAGAPTYEWTGEKWTAMGSGGGSASIIVSVGAPATPTAGMMWWESDSGRLFIYYDDGNSQQWVEVPAPNVDMTGFVTQAQLTTTLAGYLPLTGGTLTGGLTLNNAMIRVNRNGNTHDQAMQVWNNFDTTATLVGGLGTTGSPGWMVVYDQGGAGLCFRPTAYNSTAGQMLLYPSGDLAIAADVTCSTLTTSSTMTIRGNTVTGAGDYNAATAQPGVLLGNNGRIYSKGSGTANQTHFYVYNNASVTPAGVGSIQSSGSATTFNTSSDERLKENIAAYDPDAAIAIIRADPVQAFNWKIDGKPAVGWIAQRSYAVSPDLATPGEGEPGDDEFMPWGVDQGKRTPYLWAALSRALDRIDELEARLAALEALNGGV